MNDKTVQQAILDALNQHNSYLQRLSSTSVNEVLKKFDSLSVEMLNKLRDLLEDLSESELAALASGKYSTSNLKEIQSILQGWQQSISVVLPEIFTTSAIALAVHEAGYIYDLADTQKPELKGETLFNKAKKIPYAGGQLVDFIFPGIAQNVRQKIEYIIRDGVNSGLTNQQIVQRIKGTKKLNYSDGLLNKTRNSIDAEVRTARSHISNNVYLQTWEALGFEYTRDIATLDFRTSSTCQAFDGRVQKIGIGHQKPPYHRRCRTVQVGCDKDGKLDGTRPYVKPSRDGDKKLDIGQVDANETYATWFARQDEDYQENLLGPARFKLYKGGKYTIDKFVDPLSGEKYTLEELRQMDQQTFKNLGL